MRKYICDNCGKEFDSPTHCGPETDGYKVSNLFTLSFYPTDAILDPQSFKFGEYCEECRKKIEARIKEGVN